LRYSLDLTSALHYSFAAYYSDFSAAGHSIDPRLGIVWTPNAASALRVSIGETFQSPQLTSLFVPAQLPGPVNGYISVGNPNLVAERSTEYDVGYEHLFGVEQHQAHFAVDVYRTNIRDGISTYIPPVTCPPSDPSNDPACLSYPINVASQVYTGFESHADVKMGYRTSVHAAFGAESVYVTSVPPTTQDGTIVPFEQALGVPLHKASLAFEYNASRFASYAAGISYEGLYNELNRAPFATLNAQATWHLRGFDVGLYGTNLTGVYDDKFTREGEGVPYGGSGGPIATNALPLPGRVFTVAVTRRM
jgi:outer membrane receptor protein involved in Fe transport